ncbi:hypothetical protein E2562_031452 [Oryza meyeriana var. granulata]|uniref:Uncharacterized protein n=1 Tax=Oryza meyeriana var. granulata TaxID=110450 RepID=A0A6G1C1N4_9ORYZ|nr:hypothetical protein E2562_031452 [Oryza meyeriana var. granulata]
MLRPLVAYSRCAASPPLPNQAPPETTTATKAGELAVRLRRYDTFISFLIYSAPCSAQPRPPPSRDGLAVMPS